MTAIARESDGAVYHVKKMRSEASFWLPIYHYRAAAGSWLKLSGAGTLAEARAAVQSQTLQPPWEPPAEPEFFYRS